MKNHSLTVKRKVFPSFDLKMSAKTAVAFAFEGLAIFLFASVPSFGFALSLALCCALVFARQNVLAVSPCFVVASVVFSPDWRTLLYAIAPVILLIALYAIFFKIRKNVPLWSVALCALVGMIPYVVCGCLLCGDYLKFGLCALFAVAGTFCFGICAYAVFVRSVLHKATVDELICGGITLAVTGYALCGVGGLGFYAYGAVLAFCLLFCSVCFKPQTTLFAGILFGVGASLAKWDMTYLAAAVALATASVAFSPFTKWSSALAIVAIEGIEWLLNAYSGAGWQSLVTCAVGVVCALCVPSSFTTKIKGLAKGDNRRAYTGVVNRRGRELASRLSSASDVFYDMSKNLEKFAENSSECSPDKLAKDVAKNFCGRCRDREICFSALGADTADVILPMADAAINRGKVTILDMPPFVTSRCSNMHSLASAINLSADAYKKRVSAAKSLASCKNLMSEQFAGIALVLDSLACSCAEQVNFASDDVELLKAELLKHNVVASEIVVCGEGSFVSATLVVRDCDAQKAVLARVVSKSLGARMEISKIQDKGTQKAVFLDCAPIYEVAYGIAQKKFGEESECGDTLSVLCPSRTRRLFALCDGMGHGDKASETSKNAVKMIESFYRAGIESSIVLSLVNKLLKLGSEDMFSTLDISVLDMQTGGLDVVKLGSASSFIIRKDNIEMLTCTAAPIGIVDDVDSITSRYQLFDGDMVLMMSDGVFDALDSKGVCEVIDEADTQNPQTLADVVLEKALQNGANDDCTVLALRLFMT